MSTALYFKYNTQLGPPYQVLVDTNFINFAIKNKVPCSYRVPCIAALLVKQAIRILMPYDVDKHLRSWRLTHSSALPLHASAVCAVVLTSHRALQ